MNTKQGIINMFVVSNCLLILITLGHAEFADSIDSCNSSLGLEAGALRNDQFYATSYYPGYNASEARLNVGAGWVTYRSDGNQYLKLSLDDIWTVTAVTVQSATYRGTTRLRISYSENNLTWTAYTSLLSTDLLGDQLVAVTDGHDVIKIPLDPPITARYIAFNPTEWYWYPALSLELYGCLHAPGSQPAFTNIRGDIMDDRVWVASQSPIVIGSKVTVRPSASLTIQAGVSVIFTSPDAGLDVFGSLSAHGISGVPVLFSANHPQTSLRNLWQGIQVRATGRLNISTSVVRQAVVGISGSANVTTIDDSVVYLCETGVRISDGISENATMTYILTGTVLKYNIQGISAHGTRAAPHVNIRGCEVSLNDGNGITIYDWESQSLVNTVMKILDTEISYNSGIGIEIGYVSGQLYVYNSSFIGNRQQGINASHDNNGFYFNVTLVSSVFDSNVYDAISMYCSSCSDLNINIKHNIFKHNIQRAIYIDSRDTDNTVYLALDGNEIHGHSGRRAPVELRLSSASVYEITGNIFHDNDAGLYLNASDNEVRANVSANIFANTHGMSLPVISVQSGLTLNFTANHVHNSSARSIIELATGMNHVIVNNNFTDNQHVPCYVKVHSVFSRERAILANNNYWGSAAIADVKAKICDFFLDAARSRVRVDTYYQTPEMNTAMAVPNVDDFSYGYNADLGVVVIGGVIRTKMAADYLSGQGWSVLVNRSLIIDKDGSLNVAGINVSFAENRGAVVYGSLHVGSVSAALTLIQPQFSNRSWHGIDVHGGEISISYTNVSYAKSFINLEASSKVVLKNTNAEHVDNFINALMLNDNLSVIMDQCTIDAKETFVRIRLNTARDVYIELKNCIIHTQEAHALDIQQTQDQRNRSQVIVIMDNTKVLTTNASTLFFVGCSSHFIVNITKSSFETRNRQAVYTDVLSLNLFAHNNTFVDNADTFSLQFCGRQFEGNVSSCKEITISSNMFTSRWPGAYISINASQGGTSDTYHTFSISKNMFAMMGRTAVHFYGETAGIVIDNNHFYKINITDNVFMYNDAEGIIELLPAPSMEYNMTVVGNRFVNNTATALKVAGPFAKIHNNFFDNPDANYDLEIMPHNEKWRNSSLNASLNYWGTTDVKNIARKIHDAYYDESLLPVIFRPYLGSWNTTDIRNEEDHFVNPSGEVGGLLRSDVTLSADDSPYRVIYNIEVAENASLTVEAGVKLVFKANVGATVYGSLNVMGTINDPVYMVPELEGDRWRGLDIKPSKRGSSSLTSLRVNNTQLGIRLSSNTIVNDVWSLYSDDSGFLVNLDDGTFLQVGEDSHRLAPEASIPGKRRHVHGMIMVRAEHNRKSGIEIALSGHPNNTVSFHVDNCWVSDNSEDGFNIRANATVVISNCYIGNNRLSGVSISQDEGGETHLISSTLVNNKHYALYAYQTEGLLLESCLVCNHTYGQYHYYWGTWDSREYILIKKPNMNDFHVTMRNNTFRDNVADGIVISLDYPANGNYSFIVEDNYFVGGNRSVSVIDSSYRYYSKWLDLSVRNNTFENNVDFTKELMSFSLTTVANLSISDNTFINNTCNRVIAFEKGNGLITSYITLSIMNNIFNYNSISNVVMDLQTTHNWYVSGNVFHNPSAECELRAPYFVDTIRVVATHNYWGSAELRHVADRVCGFQKTMSRSLVSYIPYYVDIERTELVSLNESATPGGELTGFTRLTVANSPYNISRSLYIRNGSRLEIEDGVELQFQTDTGIYAQGSLETLGSPDSPVVMCGKNGTTWHGVIIANNPSDKSKIMHTHIVNTAIGLTVHGDTTTIRSIIVSRSQGAGITIIKGDTVYNFTGSRIEHTQNDGLTIEDSRNITISDVFVSNINGNGIAVVGSGNLTISNSVLRTCKASGVYRYVNNGYLALYNCSISDCGIAINGRNRYNPYNHFTMELCTIANNARGLVVSMDYHYNNVTMEVNRNTFVNNALDTLKWTLRRSYNRDNDGTVNVGFNTFVNSTGISLLTRYNVNVSFHDNSITNTSAVDKDGSCLLDVISPYDVASKFTDVLANVFQYNDVGCVVKLASSEIVHLSGRFMYNKLLDNKAMTGIVEVATYSFNISENIFDNQDSVFDLYVIQTGEGIINASRNWWGSSDPTVARSRVFDKSIDPMLLSVNITPILTEVMFDCSRRDNCSGHGECVRPDGCRCYYGWTGSKCIDYDCSGAADCYNHGECVGHNTCQCHEGWTGPECIFAMCNNVNNCSGHGVCVRPDTCTCASTFTGPDCGSCIGLHWGTDCKACPACQQGTCDLQTGVCDCTDINWSGYLCDHCSEAYYGPHCLPLMKALTLIPTQGLDKGGQSVHVWGHNFQATQNQTYLCRFGTEVVMGTRYAWNHVVCPAPQHEEGDVILEVSPNGAEYTNAQLIYTFYATCPLGACGRELSPPRGHCLLGECSCDLPWVGDDCSIELLPPVIRKLQAVQNVTESRKYVQQLQLTQGNTPVSWSLASGPQGMWVDRRTGLVEWQSAIASLTPYVIVVTATNLIGQDSVTWTFGVDMSYTARVTKLFPSGVLPSPKPIRISGVITYVHDSPTVVPVEIRVHSVLSGRTTTIVELSDPLDSASFSATYYPRPDDAGHFDVIGYHPAANQSEYDMRWSVLGIRCRPSSVSVDVVIDGNTVVRDNITTLANVGGFPLHNVSSSITGISDAYLRLSDRPETHNPTLGTLEESEGAQFDLILTTARPLSGTIYALFSTEAGTIARLRIYIRLTIRKPLFVFDLVSIHGNVVRGTQNIFDIGLRNVGDVAAKGVTVALPSDRRLSLVSFAVVSADWGPQEQKTILAAGERAVISVAITIADDEALGEMWGSIAVNSELTSSAVNYRFYVTSERRMDLKVLVEDEYTYFASGNPLLSGAHVTLTNPTRGYRETIISNEQVGYVVFEDVYEDRYTIHATAEDHSSYSAIPILHADTPEMKIFLQRVAVKYTWTVTPTFVKDIYAITLDSTFGTYVPMPVVTIEPAKVNRIPYELGQMDTIVFTISNHGLIRANNLRFSLPTDDPYLNFESEIETIGSIDANSSIVVPVKATPKSTRRKRNAPTTGTCGMILLYDYVCGGTQTRFLGVTLITREYQGGPPLPCGGGNLYGRLRTGLLGYSVAYHPVTPITCGSTVTAECLKTYFKSCILAFVPVVGCGVTIFDLVVSRMQLIHRLLDTFMACVVGSIPLPSAQIASEAYSTIGCINDINSKCSHGGRRRRDVTSDVINDVLHTAVPLGNFMDLMTDILGDKNMYEVGRVWYPAFKAAVADDSDVDARLSMAEKMAVLETVSEAAARRTLDKFLIRWNNTAAAWEDGSLNEMTNASHVININALSPRIEQYVNDTVTAKQAGFNSIFDAFDHALHEFQVAEKGSQSHSDGKAGAVCAKVRMRIVQELVLTRDAFTARLELENGESSELRNIKVDIEIRATYGGVELANDVFSIGTPTLTGISGVDGTGVLGMDLSGSAEWLMIPYSHAAPMDDIQYDVGGRMSYSDGTADFSVSLLPDTISVRPNPSLEVHYFHEIYVQGDDALTTDVTEPMVPFSLAVMVTNTGYGVARALKIASAQPKIIENEKGLLVAFKIIGAHMGSKPMTPSLTVDFGDISSFETKTARWLLTSTLKGTFSNFSATFENINPLGDPQLSLLDDLGYHELLHLVRIDDTGDVDDVDDFLVNDVEDNSDMPDRLYNSNNGTDVADVLISNVTSISAAGIVRPPGKVYTSVTLGVNTNVTSWFYLRIENNLTSPLPEDNMYLLRATRVDDGKELIVDKNVWLTTHIQDTFLLHLLDFFHHNTSDVVSLSYTLTFGPRNLYTPVFSEDSYFTSISWQTPVNVQVLKVSATDVDNNSVVYSMTSDDDVPYSVDTDGTVRVARWPLNEVDMVEFNVTVTDDGIPARTATALVSLAVTRQPYSSTGATTGSATGALTGTATSPVAPTAQTTCTTRPTSHVSGTTRMPSTTSTEAEAAVDNSIASWFIPTAVGAGVFVVLIALIAVYICALRKTGSS